MIDIRISTCSASRTSVVQLTFEWLIHCLTTHKKPLPRFCLLNNRFALFGHLTSLHFLDFKAADRFLSNNLSLVVCISS